MIDETMRFLADALNAHLDRHLGRQTEAYAVASALSSPDGALAQGIEQRVVLAIVNIERETGAGMLAPRAARTQEGSYAQMPAPISLNLSVLMASHHPRYTEALKRLSASIGFVQVHPVFEGSAWPTFPQRLERITTEVVNLDLHALSNLWNALGVKYMPSVLLRVRMLTIDEGRAERRIPEVQGLERSLNPRPL